MKKNEESDGLLLLLLQVPCAFRSYTNPLGIAFSPHLHSPVTGKASRAEFLLVIRHRNPDGSRGGDPIRE